jgi:hypothetical protein
VPQAPVVKTVGSPLLLMACACLDGIESAGHIFQSHKIAHDSEQPLWNGYEPEGRKFESLRGTYPTFGSFIPLETLKKLTPLTPFDKLCCLPRETVERSKVIHAML